MVYDAFQEPLSVREVPEPDCPDDGVLVRVRATGLCRSDWHGWQGHDADITSFPHVPGHELAGEVAAVGPQVTGWQVGDRVTAPFVLACGDCPECTAGDQQVCRRQRQPGFTHWGSWAELVALPSADVNLVRLPASMSFATAASLGCRYATAYRAVVQVGRVAPGETVAVLGCGGVGLSAVQVAVASGASVVAVDVNGAALGLASSFGASPVSVDDLVGVDLALDCFGSPDLARAGVLSLRRRGRFVQVGLLQEEPRIPLGRVLAWELEVLGSHGMAAHTYPALLDLVASGRLDPASLVAREISLDEAPAALASPAGPGITVICP